VPYGVGLGAAGCAPPEDRGELAVYEGLYNARKGLSEQDAILVGAMTARLLFPWDAWVHRRVERITFCDEDALRREISVDFTLPNWFHDRRRTPRIATRRLDSFTHLGRHEPSPAIPPAKRQLVPIGWLRKGVLVNFSLRDEQGKSLPLLNTAQNAQVAEAVLTAIASSGLNDDVPREIRCDIRHLVRAKHDKPRPNGQKGDTAAELAYKELFSRRDSAIVERERLEQFLPFRTTAFTCIQFLLALTMLDIHRQQRRIVHLSYEETLWQRPEPNARTRFGRGWKLAKGEPRAMTFEVPAVADTDSYHLEIEAPDGHMVSERESFQYQGTSPALQEERNAGSFRRAHFHFSQSAHGTLAFVTVRLMPRESTIIRSATFTSILAFLAMAALVVRFQHVEGAEAAAAILLSFTGLVGTFVIRNSDDNMATSLLLPLRALAMLPVGFAFIAAIVVVIEPSILVGRVALSCCAIATALCIRYLVRNWREAVRTKAQ